MTGGRDEGERERKADFVVLWVVGSSWLMRLLIRGMFTFYLKRGGGRGGGERKGGGRGKGEEMKGDEANVGNIG